MDYFVTGATGVIGKQLLPLLLARGGEVGVLVRKGSGAVTVIRWRSPERAGLTRAAAISSAVRTAYGRHKG